MEIDRIMKLVFGLASLGLLCGSLFVEEIGILFIIGAIMLLALIHVLDAIVDRKIEIKKPKAEVIKPVVAEIKPVEPVPVAAAPVAIPEPPKPETKKEEKVEVKKETKETEEKKVFKCKHCGKKFEEEKKLRRHFGMAHYDKLEI